MVTEFDKFLFASISVGTNDMPVTVLSALAREDIDPWQEAAKLAELPEYAAVGRLSSAIAQYSGRSPTSPGSEEIAISLIALLPRRAIPAAAAAPNAAGLQSTVNIYVLVVAVLLGAQCAMAAIHPSAQVDNAHGPIINTYFPQTPPSSVDK